MTQTSRETAIAAALARIPADIKAATAMWKAEVEAVECLTDDPNADYAVIDAGCERIERLFVALNAAFAGRRGWFDEELLNLRNTVKYARRAVNR